MARGGGDRGKRNVKERDTRRAAKKKVCIFCKDKVVWVDYKDVNLLRRFISDRGKIRARRVTGNCAQHQRDVAVAIKTSRELALLPYQTRTVTERSRGRGPAPMVGAEAPEGLEGMEDLEALDGLVDVDLVADVEGLEEFGGAEESEV